MTLSGLQRDEGEVGVEPTRAQHEELWLRVLPLAEDAGNLHRAIGLFSSAPEPFSEGREADDTDAKSREFCEPAS